MKKWVLFLCLWAVVALAAVAQNTGADAILGVYHAVQNNDEFKARISKNTDGTYKIQVIWVKQPVDPKTGQKRLDPKNPDKSLRHVPCDKVVLCNGLKYNADKQQWEDAKIYDPQRGLRANATLWFEKGQLHVRGSIIGISETVRWTKIE